jgi:hypothetical protein
MAWVASSISTFNCEGRPRMLPSFHCVVVGV